VYKSEREKFNAIVEEVTGLWKAGRPVLVGTRSIEKSEKISAMLRGKGVPCQVLNAKYHEMEAEIIAQAGRKGAVTIATNMAGRGTDILLGGNPQDQDEYGVVKGVGGLHVLGTERHESRRIDNQLRGRCGRQGDPGSTRFYLALDDELMRLFGSDRIAPLMEKLGMKEGEVIESGLVSYQIENAQRRVETHNFDIRKQLLDYDNVMNKQREVVYKLRDEVLFGESVSEQIKAMIQEDVAEQVDAAITDETDYQTWNLLELSAYLERTFGVAWNPAPEEASRLSKEVLKRDLLKAAMDIYARRPADFTGYDFREVEKMVMLQMIDKAWKNHLYDLDHLKKSIGLRAYGQKDPLIEYQKESYAMFEKMLARVRDQMVEYVFRIQLPPVVRPRPAGETAGQQLSAGAHPPKADAKKPQEKYANLKVGRNDPCPCGSGKKYKKCHGS
ncbi:MAG: SEC-C metal-binding domain-containing protein, partial [Elusimicrobiota bacterium]|nr:SEC-C metal-binding domain-containing protein [Elusimicrobiota bacterium]